MITAIMLIIGLALIMSVAWVLLDERRLDRADIRPAQDARHVLRRNRVHQTRQRIPTIR